MNKLNSNGNSADNRRDREPLRIVYAGTPDFAVPALRLLQQSPHQVVAVYTQPDRPAGRGRKLQPSPVKSYALSENIVVEQPKNFAESSAIEQLRSYQVDVMIVAAYGVLLPPEVLELPRHGCLNIHASLLPRWRGAAPLQRAILAGDAVSGASIMQMDEGLDTGPVLQRQSVPIEITTTAAQLHDQVAEVGSKALLEILPQWCAGAVTAQAQLDTEACYAKKLQKAEAQLDWQQPVLSVHRRIMAFNPWPVAQTLLPANDETNTGKSARVLRIWRSLPLQKEDAIRDQAGLENSGGKMTNWQSGTVVQLDNRLFVRCSDDWLELLEVQLPGKRAMAVADYLKGNSPHGCILGSDDGSL